MASDEYAMVLMPGSDSPQVWPTRGRSKESFDAYCATCGATVIKGYASIEEAIEAIYLPINDRFANIRGLQIELAKVVIAV
jgi:hypothetical protein